MSSMPNLSRMPSSYCTHVQDASTSNRGGQDLSGYVADSCRPFLQEFFRFECTFCGHASEHGTCGECGRVDHAASAADLAKIADALPTDPTLSAADLGEILVEEVAAGHLPVATLSEIEAVVGAHLSRNVVRLRVAA